MPPAQAGAQWAEATTECCVVHYITGTAAERDLPALMAMVDQQAEHAVQAMGIEFTEPITITVMPRVLGHGGFASDEIYVSYLDRNYAANSWEMVVHHEMIHILDRRLGGDLRPSILVEGLAVYHERRALQARGAAAAGRSAAGGTAQLRSFHWRNWQRISITPSTRSATWKPGHWCSIWWRPTDGRGSPASTGISTRRQAAARQRHWRQRCKPILANPWQNWSRLSSPSCASRRMQTDWQEDVRLTVTYFDTLRRYQELLDPIGLLQNRLADGRPIHARTRYRRRPAAPPQPTSQPGAGGAVHHRQRRAGQRGYRSSGAECWQ